MKKKPTTKSEKQPTSPTKRLLTVSERMRLQEAQVQFCKACLQEAEAKLSLSEAEYKQVGALQLMRELDAEFGPCIIP